MPQLFDALVTFLNKEVVHFFQRQVGGFWVEEVDQGDESKVEAHEDEVRLPCELSRLLVKQFRLLCFTSPREATYIGNERRTDHHNDKVLKAKVSTGGEAKWS